MSIFSPKKGQNITIITKKGEKILVSVGIFLGKIYFLNGIILSTIFMVTIAKVITTAALVPTNNELVIKPRVADIPVIVNPPILSDVPVAAVAASGMVPVTLTGSDVLDADVMETFKGEP